MAMIIPGTTTSMMPICTKRVVRKIRINNLGNIGALAPIARSALTLWPADTSWIINITPPARMALPINPEKVDAAEACSKICCCSGDIFWTRSNNPLLPLTGTPSLSCASCASLGEKTCPNTTVINAHSNDTNRMVINWLRKKFPVSRYTDCAVIDMHSPWVLCRC